MLVSTSELLIISGLNRQRMPSGTLRELARLLENKKSVNLEEVLYCFRGILGQIRPPYAMTAKWEVLDRILFYYFHITHENLRQQYNAKQYATWIPILCPNGVPENPLESNNLTCSADALITLCGLGLNELRSGTLRNLNALLQKETTTHVSLAEVMACFYEILGTQEPVQTITAKWTVLKKITQEHLAIPLPKFMNQLKIIGVTRESVPAFLELCCLTKDVNEGGKILDSIIGEFSWNEFSSILKLINLTFQSCARNSQNLYTLFQIIRVMQLDTITEKKIPACIEIINCLEKLKNPNYGIANEHGFIHVCFKLQGAGLLNLLEQCLRIKYLEKFITRFEDQEEDIELYFAQFSDENLKLFIDFHREMDGFEKYTTFIPGSNSFIPPLMSNEPLLVSLEDIKEMLPDFFTDRIKDHSPFLSVIKEIDDARTYVSPYEYTCLLMCRNALIERYSYGYPLQQVKASLSAAKSLDTNIGWSIFVIHFLLSHAGLEESFYQWPLPHIIKNHTFIKESLLLLQEECPLIKKYLPPVIALQATGLDVAEKKAVEILRTNLMEFSEFKRVYVSPLLEKYKDWAQYVPKTELLETAENLDRIDPEIQKSFKQSLGLLRKHHYLGVAHEYEFTIRLVISLIANGETHSLINSDRCEVLMLVAVKNNIQNKEEILSLYNKYSSQNLNEVVNEQFSNCPGYYPILQAPRRLSFINSQAPSENSFPVGKNLLVPDQ